MFVKFCIGLRKEFLENRRSDGHNFRIGVNKITFTCASCNCVILDTTERLGNVKNMPLSTLFLFLTGTEWLPLQHKHGEFNVVALNCQDVNVI